MEKNIKPLEKGNSKQQNTYTVTIDKNIFHVVSQFQGTETSSQIIYSLAVKRILYNDSI